MPQFNRRELDTRAREYGFNRDTFEKVLRLRKILEFLNTQEYMREHLLLKRGTARWMFLSHPEIKTKLWGGHLWNPSYCVVTVSDRSREQIINYINSQKER